MTRRFSLSLATLAFAAALAPACSSVKEDPQDDFSDLAGLDTKSDTFNSRSKVIGSIAYGETQSGIAYTSPPKTRLLSFSGRAGNPVNAWVRSNGDAVGWLLSPSFKQLKMNDDASSSTLNAHLVFTLTETGTHYIAFRDYDYADATFAITLKGPAAPAVDFFACHKDTDCVAIYEGGCCPNGRKVSVAKSEKTAYEDAHQCTNPPALCPLAVILDDRVSECNTGTQKCEMVEPTAMACGGNTTNPHACAPGYTCRINRIPDVPGHCVKSTP